MAHFPMFVDLTTKKCLIVGGGTIASHKIGVLSDFGPEITVIAPEISEEIREMEKAGNVLLHVLEREVKEADIDGFDLVVSATDDSALNHQVSMWCQDRRIPVNAVDQPEDCTFIFPSYVRAHDVVGAFSSGGKSPVITQYLKGKSKEYITDFLGELADYLGSIREDVKAEYPDMKDRREYFKQVLEKSLESGKIES